MSISFSVCFPDGLGDTLDIPPDFIGSADELRKIFQVWKQHRRVYLHVVDDVQVIGHLQVSYLDREVSIIVHRVGDTLHLGGDFNVSQLFSVFKV